MVDEKPGEKSEIQANTNPATQATPAAPQAPGTTPPPANATPPPAGQGAESLAEIDALLKAQDPNFSKEFESLKSDLHGVDASHVKLESLGLPTDLDQDHKEDKAHEAVLQKLNEVKPPRAPKPKGPPQPKLLPVLIKTLWSLVILIPKILMQVLPALKKIKKVPPKELMAEVQPQVKEVVSQTVGQIKALISVLKSLHPLAYIKTAILIALVYGSVIAIKASLVSLKYGDTVDVEVVTFEKVADRVVDLEEEQGDGEEVLSQPEFVVQIARVIANLKPTGRSLSMVSLELYLEGSSQEAAMEIKDREQEVRHTIARVLEQFTFDTLDSTDGKLRLKIHLRAALNKILSKGRVLRIFYRSFHIQK